MNELAKEYIIPFVKLPEAQGGWVSPHILFNTREEAEKWREEPNSISPGLQVYYVRWNCSLSYTAKRKR